MSDLTGLGSLISGGASGVGPSSLMSPPMDPRILQMIQQMGSGGPQGLPPGASQLPPGMPPMQGAPPMMQGPHPLGPMGAPPAAPGLPPVGQMGPPGGGGLLQLIASMPPDQLRMVLARLGIGGQPGMGAPQGGMPQMAKPY